VALRTEPFTRPPASRVARTWSPLTSSRAAGPVAWTNPNWPAFRGRCASGPPAVWVTRLGRAAAPASTECCAAQPAGKPMRAVSPDRENTPTWVVATAPPAPLVSTLACTSWVAVRRLRPTAQLPDVKRMATTGMATHASSGRPRRRAAKKTTGPTTKT
jgi:hypothetical protein